MARLFLLLCLYTKNNEARMAKILIAEDERDIRDLVAFTLRFAGHEVFAASNGEEAVELAAS